MPARFRVLVLALAFVSPSLAYAQQHSPPQTATRVEQSAGPRVEQAAGPRVEATATAFRKTTQSADSAAMLQRSRQNVGQPVAMMIVGGAAIVLGAVIGDEIGTIFMIGGAVALLYGLYKYLQ